MNYARVSKDVWNCSVRNFMQMESSSSSSASASSASSSSFSFPIHSLDHLSHSSPLLFFFYIFGWINTCHWSISDRNSTHDAAQAKKKWEKRKNRKLRKARSNGGKMDSVFLFVFQKTRNGAASSSRCGETRLRSAAFFIRSRSCLYLGHSLPFSLSLSCSLCVRSERRKDSNEKVEKEAEKWQKM